MSKILIIDDSLTVRQQLAATLTGAGYAIVEACDGEDAWTRLGAHGAEITLAICDVNMPRLGGLELLERMRGTPQFETLPVMMLTTEGQPDVIAKAKSFGAKGWMVKPFKSELMLAAVKKLAGPPK